MFQTKILATGIYTPRKVLTNYDLEKSLDTSHDWIVERTGIVERRISDYETGDEWPTDMAAKATMSALKEAGLEANDIDLIIFSTSTPDVKMPSCACLLQHKLGISNQCASFDLSAACSGFVYAFNMADGMIRSGMFENILVVGAECMTREVDWQDRSMCVLFGDAAGVTILSRSEEQTGNSSQVLAGHLIADGSGHEFFTQHIGGVKNPVTHENLDERTQFMQMKGRELFKAATRTLAESAKVVMEKAGLTIDDIDWIVPHQANARIIETTGKLLGVNPDKVIVNIQKYGNTSAATIPLAFHEAIKEGKIKRGDIVLFDAFGAGVTAGATLFRY